MLVLNKHYSLFVRFQCPLANNHDLQPRYSYLFNETIFSCKQSLATVNQQISLKKIDPILLRTFFETSSAVCQMLYEKGPHPRHEPDGFQPLLIIYLWSVKWKNKITSQPCSSTRNNLQTLAQSVDSLVWQNGANLETGSVSWLSFLTQSAKFRQSR